MRTLIAIVMCACLVACSATTSKIDTSQIFPDRPSPISCPPSGLKKIAENVYQTDEKGYQNLKACLSDVVRYVEQSNGIYTFFTTRGIDPKKVKGLY